MLKYITKLTLALLTNSFLLAQPNTSDNYKLYSILIKTEITNKSKSVTIINKLTNDTTSLPWVTEAIKSKDPNQLEQLRFLTRDDHGNSIKAIDTSSQNLILKFYQTHLPDTALQNSFDISNVKVLLIDNFPFKTGSQEEWKEFYKKYPSSGGLFQFSNICFSEDVKEAIFYHVLYRNGLNAHGALTILHKINGEWKIKYDITFWQA